MSDLLDVDPRALTVPDIDTQLGLMHTLFAIEDMYGLKIDELDGEMVLRLDRFTPEFPALYDKFRTWLQEAKKLKGGEITKDQYDDWRYKYPELNTHKFSVDVLPKEISDALIKEEKKKSLEFPNLTCTLNIFVRVLCYDLISFGFSCPYHTDCIS